jgi:hypothetical protein
VALRVAQAARQSEVARVSKLGAPLCIWADPCGHLLFRVDIRVDMETEIVSDPGELIGERGGLHFRNWQDRLPRIEGCDGFPLGLHPNVGVVFEHRPGNMAGNGH